MAFITTMPPPPMSYRQYFFGDLRRCDCEDFRDTLADEKTDEKPDKKPDEKPDKKPDKKPEGFWDSFKNFWMVNHKIRINRIL